MDIDIIRDQKLGAGAGTRSTRVCMSAMSHVSRRESVFPLYPVLNSLGYCFCVFQHTLAEVWVQKTSEMDTSQQYHCRTFLGHLLNIGDLALG